MRAQLRAAAVLLALFTVLTGFVYPTAVTVLAQLLFPGPASGSLVVRQGRIVGSRLLGQPFTGAGYFWSRPSATTPAPYNAAASTGSNLGPTNPALADSVRARIAALRAADPEQRAPVPVDLVTSSGSGLDPDISPAAARWQAPRVARARGQPLDLLLRFVDRGTTPRTFGFLGEPRVNVLLLNLALDSAFGAPPGRSR